MFASNVQPKKVIKDRPEPWYCHKCEDEVNYWHKVCPVCRTRRGE